MLKRYTTSDELFEVLNKLMSLPDLLEFRLVGGTALSLWLGHRISEDIDLFTCKAYGTVDFSAIEAAIKMLMPVVINTDNDIPGLGNRENNFGLHLFVGYGPDSLIKVDILNWGDEFLFDEIQEGNIRMASVVEIALMKLDAIARGGRKKDFWDLSEILLTHSLKDLIEIYRQKYPYYDDALVISGLANFSVADNMPDPYCFKGKDWELIKREMKEYQKQL